MPSDNCLQFLDLNLTFLPDHVCWIYKPRVRKGLLPYESAHSKTVKRAVAMACLQGALVNSCHHRVRESFVAQVSRLLTAGFPLMVLIAVAESLLKKIKCNRTCEADAPKRKTCSFAICPQSSAQPEKCGQQARSAGSLFCPS